MENLHLTVLKDEGGVGNGASVTIYDAGTENVSTIYSDDGITPAGNPLTADAYGRTNFYAANASYDINVSGTGITEYRLYGIKLFDVKAVDETSANTDKDKAVSNNLAKIWEAKIPLTQKGSANGVAELDADSKVPSAQLPAIAITDTHVAVNEAAQLALTVQKGDVCVRSDENKSYVALNSDNVDMADWQELLTPTDLVLSVNGETGAVSLDLDDIGEGTTYKRVTATKEAQIHVQGTDQKLDEGGANEVTVANVKDAVDKKHDKQHSIVSSADHSDKQDYIDTPQSPSILTGGDISEGTTGTFTVAALTALLRATDSSTGALTKVTLAEQANQVITLADTVYVVCLNYNGGSPTITLAASNPYTSDKRNIPIGRVMKDGSNNVYYISGGFNLQDAPQKLHIRARELRKIELTSGGTIAYSGTNNFTMAAGVVYGGINRFAVASFDSAVTQFVPVYQDGAGGWTNGAARNTVDYEHYDDGDGTLGNIGNAKYGVFWIYRHIDNGSVFVLYGRDSYALAGAELADEPTKPDHLTNFGGLIGKVIAPQAGSSFTKVQMVTDTFFVGTSVSDHNKLGGLQGGTAGEYYHMTSAEETAATRDATNAQNGLMPSGVKDGYDAAVTHKDLTDNPHSTTKTQVGLSAVTNDEQIAKSLGTTKGDVIGFSGNATPVRLGVGSNGQVLKADSGEVSGVKWGTADSLYSSTFDATTDWGAAAGGYYSIQITHNLNTQDLIVQIWEENGTKVKVEADRINKDDANNLTIRVTETPDNRFAGRINICNISSSSNRSRDISFCIPGDAYVSTKLAQILVGANLANQTISKVKIYADTAPTGASLIVDVNKNGTTIFTTQNKRPEIAIGANADDSDTPDVTTMSEGDRLSVDIDQIGSTIAGGDDLLITIILAG